MPKDHLYLEHTSPAIGVTINPNIAGPSDISYGFFLGIKTAPYISVLQEKTNPLQKLPIFQPLSQYVRVLL